MKAKNPRYAFSIFFGFKFMHLLCLKNPNYHFKLRISKSQWAGKINAAFFRILEHVSHIFPRLFPRIFIHKNFFLLLNVFNKNLMSCCSQKKKKKHSMLFFFLFYFFSSICYAQFPLLKLFGAFLDSINCWNLIQEVTQFEMHFGVIL